MSQLDPDEDEPSALLDRVMRLQGQRSYGAWSVMIVLGVFGLLLGIGGGYEIAIQPWDLDASSPRVEAKTTGCDSLSGGTHTIEVDGQTFVCGGGDEKCGATGALVAYDPANPARCRAAATVDRLARYERTMVSLILGFLLLGAAGSSYAYSERLRRADMVEDSPIHTHVRARLRMLAGITLAAAVLSSTLSGLTILAGL